MAYATNFYVVFKLTVCDNVSAYSGYINDKYYDTNVESKNMTCITISYI